MRKMERKTKFFIVSICICLSLMLLSGTILVLPTATWLSKENSISGNPSDTTIARAGVTVLDGENEIVTNKTNIFDLNDIYSYSLSQNFIYDVDTNANSCTVNWYGAQLFTNAWILENLKPNTTYTFSCVMEMLNAIDSPTETLKGLYLYSSTSSSTSVYLGYITNTMTNGQTVQVANTFTTPSNLHDTTANYYIYAYSEFKNGSECSTVRFHNLTLVEKVNIIDVNDIHFNSLSNNYIYDVDTNANSCTVNRYAAEFYTNAWILENLKPNTTYTISGVMEMLDVAGGLSLDRLKGLYLYSETQMSNSALIWYTRDEMTNGQTMQITNTFTTPSNLHDTTANFVIYAYSEYVDGLFSTVRFHNLTLVEGTQISQQYYSNVVLGAANTATAVNHKVKNTGTAQELIRVYYAIKDLDNEKVLTSDDVSVSINSDFISHEKLDGVWAGYLYYNKALDAGTLVSVINSITPLSDYANKGVIIQIQAECVLYSGNAYSSGETTKYPWASVPSNWFVMP